MRWLGATLAWAAIGLPVASFAAEIDHETLDDGTEAITILGDIVSGDEQTFRELTIQYPDAVVGLDSDGGQLLPALEIGRLIRLRNYTTIVIGDGVCVSSCALIWIAGTRRLLATTGSLGFHASYFDDGGVKVESGVANALIGHYLSQLNLSQDAVIFATLAPPTEVVWLDTSNRQDAGIDFESYEPEPSVSPPPPQRAASGKGRESALAPPPPIIVAPPELPRSSGASKTEAVLRDWRRAPDFARNAARGISASAQLMEPMTEHFALLYANDRLIERVAHELDAARIDIREESDAAGSVIFRLTSSLIYLGLQRLPQKDVNRIFYYLSEVTVRQNDVCSDFVDTGHVQTGEFEAVAGLGQEPLNEYLALLRKAIFAEVENYPPRIALDASQTEIAEKAWGEFLLEKVSARGTNESERLLAAFDNLAAADPVTQCEANKIIFPALNEMGGIVGDWFRRSYLTYVTEGSP